MGIHEADGARVFLDREAKRVVMWDAERQILGLASPGTGYLDLSGEVVAQDVERFMNGVPDELASTVLEFIGGE